MTQQVSVPMIRHEMHVFGIQQNQAQSGGIRIEEMNEDNNDHVMVNPSPMTRDNWSGSENQIPTSEEDRDENADERNLTPLNIFIIVAI